MKSYSVTVQRKILQEALFQVKAENEEEAKTKAIEIAKAKDNWWWSMRPPSAIGEHQSLSAVDLGEING